MKVRKRRRSGKLVKTLLTRTVISNLLFPFGQCPDLKVISNYSLFDIVEKIGLAMHFGIFCVEITFSIWRY